MPLHIVGHPLVRHKIALARESNVTTKDFRELASEIATLLTYEATKDLETEKETIQGWAGPVEVEKIKGKKITVVPILRAGLGMMPGVLNLIPSAKVSIVGLYRNEETLAPVRYYVKLAKSMEMRVALILDPMLATGGSTVAAIDLLKESGCPQIKGIFMVAQKSAQKDDPGAQHPSQGKFHPVLCDGGRADQVMQRHSQQNRQDQRADRPKAGQPVQGEGQGGKRRGQRQSGQGAYKRRGGGKSGRGHVWAFRLRPLLRCQKSSGPTDDFHRINRI